MEYRHILRSLSETYFYSPPHQIRGKTLSLTNTEAKHVSSVLRCAEGDVITVVDGCGHEYDVSVQRMVKGRIDGEIVACRHGPREPGTQIVLAQALSRGSKFDVVVEKATELGVHTILPVITERSLKMPRREQWERRRHRWSKIAIAAMKQSKRSVLPHIASPSPFETILSLRLKYDLCLVACEREERSGLRDMLTDPASVRRVLVFIGPEGGFSEGEIQQAKEARFQTFSLGRRRLRTETAGPLAVALLVYELEDVGGR